MEVAKHRWCHDKSSACTGDCWTNSLGADPYADGGSSDSSAGSVMGGIAALGVLAWLFF